MQRWHFGFSWVHFTRRFLGSSQLAGDNTRHCAQSYLHVRQPNLVFGCPLLVRMAFTASVDMIELFFKAWTPIPGRHEISLVHVENVNTPTSVWQIRRLLEFSDEQSSACLKYRSCTWLKDRWMDSCRVLVVRLIPHAFPL